MFTRSQTNLPEAGEGHQVARYAINGLLATAVHFGVLAFNLKVIGLSSAGVSNLIAACVGLSVSFLGSRYFVFRGHSEPFLRQAGKFAGLYAAMAVLHGLVLYIWSDRLLLDFRSGFVLATGLQVVLSYFGNKTMVFNK